MLSESMALPGKGNPRGVARGGKSRAAGGLAQSATAAEFLTETWQRAQECLLPDG